MRKMANLNKQENMNTEITEKFYFLLFIIIIIFPHFKPGIWYFGPLRCS